MKTLRCTCGEVISGETGVALYDAVEAHLTDHAARLLETGDDTPRGQPEHDRKEEQ